MRSADHGYLATLGYLYSYANHVLSLGTITKKIMLWLKITALVVTNMAKDVRRSAQNALFCSTNTALDFLTSCQKYCFFVPTNAARNCLEVSLKISRGFTLTNVETQPPIMFTAFAALSPLTSSN